MQFKISELESFCRLTLNLVLVNCPMGSLLFVFQMTCPNVTSGGSKMQSRLVAKAAKYNAI